MIRVSKTADCTVTADRKPDTLPTTTTGEPVEVVPPGIPPTFIASEEEAGSVYGEEEDLEQEGEAGAEGEIDEDEEEDEGNDQSGEDAETSMVY
jgi:hypothetical protein